ncbi:hypothetical protein A6769_27510 [Nostoc punctiforme NIES-2108]|uniref:Uncharacterized protein n=1 Tax=Nostoc punctiforme NIES-2108 TaxID=1356359 RepID=A0A367R921_NOSPU|nr:hypothetical protein A6769_27510 [Nostoc punctiforme NIES-2108]
MQILLVSDRNFLRTSIQSTAGHLTPVEQICQGQNPQTPGSRLDLTSIAHLFQQRWRCFARLQAITSRKQRRKMLLKSSK